MYLVYSLNEVHFITIFLEYKNRLQVVKYIDRMKELHEDTEVAKFASRLHYNNMQITLNTSQLKLRHQCKSIFIILTQILNRSLLRRYVDLLTTSRHIDGVYIFVNRK